MTFGSDGRVNHLSEVLVTLVTAGRDFPGAAELAQALVDERHEIVGVVQNVNPTRGNALFGKEDIPLAGRENMYATLASNAPR